MEFLELIDEIGVDCEEVLDRFSNNQTLLRHFVCKFPQQNTFEQLQAAYSIYDIKVMESSTHTLKGIAANLGFAKLFEYCVTMLEDVRGNQTNLANEFNDIKIEYGRIVDLISRYLLLT